MILICNNLFLNKYKLESLNRGRGRDFFDKLNCHEI